MRSRKVSVRLYITYTVILDIPQGGAPSPRRICLVCTIYPVGEHIVLPRNVKSCGFGRSLRRLRSRRGRTLFAPYGYASANALHGGVRAEGELRQSRKRSHPWVPRPTVYFISRSLFEILLPSRPGFPALPPFAACCRHSRLQRHNWSFSRPNRPLCRRETRSDR